MMVKYRLPTVSLSAYADPKAQPQQPILEDICLPPYYGTKAHDDFHALMSIIVDRKPRTVLELGTAHGNTVANICLNSPGATVYTVNAPVEEQTGELVTYGLTREEIGRVYRKHTAADRVVQIFQNTLHLDLAKYIEKSTLDLAIIDACHDTDYVLNDFEKVHSYMRPGGLILFHDTHPSMKSHLAGSYIACMALRKKGFDVKHIDGTRWAILTC